MAARKVIIAGAGGRDFHNFNTAFRDNADYAVVCFTATQIPNIDDRRYPPELAGRLYPEGIPIYDEADLPRLIVEYNVDEVVFSYSDVSHQHVMTMGSLAIAAGADYRLMGTRATMVESTAAMITICAVRTGCGKSQTTRYVSRILHEAGKRVVAIRHPMPYGDLKKQQVQRFAGLADLDRHECTIEEREEYETHIESGTVVYAGVDFSAIMEQAQAEADVLIWDGGNNDTPFYRPDLWITVTDPLRPGHELSYHPGETNLRGADVVVINKVTVAKPEDVDTVADNAARFNPGAVVVRAESKIFVEDPSLIEGKRVLLVEDGPTVTHGEMPFGAAKIAADQFGAAAVVDPRSKVVGSIQETYDKYPHLGKTLPAMGYSDEQRESLEQIINTVDCDTVLYATPIDLGRLLKVDKPAVRVRYELADLASPTLGEQVEAFLTKL